MSVELSLLSCQDADQERKVPHRLQPFLPNGWNQLPDNDQYSRQFVENGWCPHQIQEIEDSYTTEVVSYLSNLRRNGFRRIDHRSCGQSPRCVASNVNMDNYLTRHIRSDCQCPTVGTSYDHIISIIQSGGVPLVSVVEVGGHMALHVEPRTAQSRYTAISHVWSDGLGNPSANALPHCQLKYIATCLKNMPRKTGERNVLGVGPVLIDWGRQNFSTSGRSSPLFWIDTLCIPVRDRDRHLRLQAINQMASIYAAAVQVLVLDAELQQTRTNHIHASELLARIVFSAWMNRSWTYQEGVLARACVYQFADAAIDPVHAWCISGHRKGQPSTNIGFHHPQDDHLERIYTALYNSHWEKLHQNWKSSWPKSNRFFSRNLPWEGFNAPKAVLGTRNNAECILNVLKSQDRDEQYRELESTRLRRNRFRFLVHLWQRYHAPETDSATRGDVEHYTTLASELGRVRQFAYSWNELAGRSTTMADDIHVIIANLLDFHADTVMSYHDRQHRMEAMVLSFQLLPFSLFYNTGPKYDQHRQHRNRWVPVEPSKCYLTTSPTVKQCPEAAVLELVDVAKELKVFLVEDLDGTKSFNIHSQKKGVTYSIQPQTTVDGEDLFFKGTKCIVLENSGFDSGNMKIRGACFRVTQHDGAENCRANEDALIGNLRLVFEFPIEAHRLEAREHLSNILEIDGPVLEEYEAFVVSSSCRILIEYGFQCLPTNYYVADTY
ncbi:uncharacterized protein K452DRAFT_304894 [Aplosporella prunicola CBS 121167]|uniref:Heterokaryon incompatibility domain-containing protein n=1 Tax=Aplosporella prunicola CBS 121167 TaxID=1176127 RepID=A0A6A6BTC8_9PEZI|nr:uncharacterized protein K452DRAFT_304894 [Aplosporella prunicola CBS 121167]KAF2145871.1 hypothetical protein K452DRAFT_304894 [Aplosporella prunicola CBS 121167]